MLLSRFCFPALSAVLCSGCLTHAGRTTTKFENPLAVKILTKRDGTQTHFYVDNREYCEVTMTFEMGLSNLKGSAQFPYTATFPAHGVTEAFILSPENPDQKWEYSYTNYFKLGSSEAVHEDSYIYQLPYAPGSTYKVTQAFGGSFSHKGSNLYAIDWQMREGTPVYAARGGIVVKTKDTSDTGGGSMKFDPYNNYVLIRHEDGTLGHYCHLKKGGVCVRPGQIVKVGDKLALSGNTGFSSGPHLHFCVFKIKNGRERVSIPIKFQTAGDLAVTLLEGKKYQARTITAVSSTPLASSRLEPRAIGRGAPGS